MSQAMMFVQKKVARVVKWTITATILHPTWQHVLSIYPTLTFSFDIDIFMFDLKIEK